MHNTVSFLPHTEDICSVLTSCLQLSTANFCDIITSISNDIVTSRVTWDLIIFWDKNRGEIHSCWSRLSGPSDSLTWSYFVDSKCNPCAKRDSAPWSRNLEVSNKYYTTIFIVNLEVETVVCPSAGVSLKISRVINCTIFLRIQRESMDPVNLGDPKKREGLEESSNAGRATLG